MAYSTISKPSLYFNTKLYTGNGGTNAITGVGFQPDFTWLKDRTGTNNHELNDAVRGANHQVFSNLTNAETTPTNHLNAFNSDGFTLGNDGSVNTNSSNYCSWNWKANGQGSSNTDGSINTTYTSVNTTAGFSIIKYNGTGSVGTIGHGLGAKPNVIIQKKLNGSTAWTVYHDKVSANPAEKYLYLNTTAALADYADHWNDTEPTSSLITLGTDSSVNGSGAPNIIYAFTEKQGYSKFGTYTGNGNADGTFIYTGFKPAFIMAKTSSQAGNWFMWDNKRPNEFNLVDSFLEADGNVVEYTSNANHSIDILSNGFKMRGTGGTNNSGRVNIYMAFAEEPLVANVGASIPATAR